MTTWIRMKIHKFEKERIKDVDDGSNNMNPWHVYPILNVYPKQKTIESIYQRFFFFSFFFQEMLSNHVP